ncbi:MAG: pantetheine-phosphate adenylyltransferase [Gracilimonas sp.]|uniref:pantetheine-phosphate adenylyltransferase n=1 Tax=Gracilimonas sp. TaxID=1974203 RepID=UPI001B227BB3|nr:pantetheine-phosphate adenylyltransferase [Gracilimonas sp.]MBO6584608.1 pantetheine-phosphate adenylyltransferase [Gracilimonas sp.]MBO6616121.1 pantetheine-phosphate adenylyltransferase [Gracilimonas sp.]
MKTIALYPGSFDPITNGHLDILERATNLFDHVIVTVAVNKKKKAVFSGEERVNLIEACIANKAWSENVEVNQFTGLLVDHAQKMNADTLVRGVRQISDFEYEFRMALTNKRLAPNVDTVFLMPDEEFTFISASIVKEVAYWGGDLSSFVPENVAMALKEKFKDKG